ncbi:HXXXD-type acyl-transferase family protein [Striga hermonthica]|uniref:HXXXD-type acyl-transferase family protein n=1 Tax=Striga hermonthica TaxID=68872 RepID=A0A9N7NAC0_STRHE|nr:HXXXD-type acyl-transferase family protein [Striga hermonthica]
MAKVEVVSSSLVPMASVDTIPMSRLDLTPWDLQMLLFEPIQQGVLFHKPTFAIDFIIDYVKASLSRVLDYFPPLAGRLATENNNNDTKTAVYFVDCNNKGAGIIHAAAPNVSVSQISDAKYTPEFVYSFFPLNGTRNFHGTFEPLFAVQVTELEDGLFFGCAANHAVMDGSSMWHVLQSLSEIVRGHKKISKMPSFARDFPGWQNRPIHVPMPDDGTTKTATRPMLLDRVFHVSKESVAEIKARAGPDVGMITSFQAIVAHVWRCVARCRRQLGVGGGEETMVTGVGARGRVDLPEGYFGNAISGSTLCMGEEELLGGGLGRAVLGLKAFVDREGTAEAVLGFVRDWAKNPRVHVPGSCTLLVSSLPNFDAYRGIGDVGLGRAVAVRTGRAQKWNGRVAIFNAAEGDGVDVEVCLAPEVMAALEEDTEFMDSTLLQNIK